MSIFKKKLATIVAVSCVGVLCLGFGVSALLDSNAQSVSAEDSTLTATNVENLISVDASGKFSGVIGYANTSDAQKIDTTDKVQAYFSDSSGVYQTYVSTVAKGETEKVSSINAGLYSQNKYSGNLSYQTTYPASSTAMKTFLFPTTNTESVISFRTVYQGTSLYLMGEMPNTKYATHANGVGGWGFVVNSDHVALNAFYEKTTMTTTTNFGRYALGSGKTLTAGDELLITYGATVATEGKTYYVKISKYANGSLTDILEESMTSSLTIGTWSSTANTGNTHLAIGTSVKVPLILGGVENPLFDVAMEYDVPNLDEKEYALEEDQPLSSLSLEAGYAFVDSDALAQAGTNKYEGTYTGAYYEKSYVWDAVITVTAKTLHTYNVILKYATGQNIATISLKEGQSYTLENVSTTGKTFIGWVNVNDKKLYNAGYKVADLAADVTYTLAEIEYKLADGASVRYKTDENYNGGLRFVLLINKADYETYKNYFTGFTGVIAPADEYIVKGAFIDSVYAQDFVGATDLDLDNSVETEIDGTAYLQVPFALTNIMYSNFNRVFAAMSYATVKYADDTKGTIATAYDAKNNSRSIYERATDLLATHYKAEYDGDYVNMLSANKVAILEAYVDQTVDIVLTEKENETEHTLDVKVSDYETGIPSQYRNAEGVSTDATLAEKEVKKIPYSVEATATYENGVYTVTLTVKFDNALGAKGFLSSADDGVYHVPVVVRVHNGEEWEIYRMSPSEGSTVLYKSISYDEETATAKITFEYRG